jgi:hypothetical protein
MSNRRAGHDYNTLNRLKKRSRTFDDIPQVASASAIVPPFVENTPTYSLNNFSLPAVAQWGFAVPASDMTTPGVGGSQIPSEFPPFHFHPFFLEPIIQPPPLPKPSPPSYAPQSPVPSLEDLASRAAAGKAENLFDDTPKAIIIKAQPHHSFGSLSHLTYQEPAKYLENPVEWCELASPQRAPQSEQVNASISPSTSAAIDLFRIPVDDIPHALSGSGLALVDETEKESMKPPDEGRSSQKTARKRSTKYVKMKPPSRYEYYLCVSCYKLTLSRRRKIIKRAGRAGRLQCLQCRKSKRGLEVFPPSTSPPQPLTRCSVSPTAKIPRADVLDVYSAACPALPEPMAEKKRIVVHSSMGRPPPQGRTCVRREQG